MHIELHIDELLLHGFAPAHRHRLGEAAARELAQLFTEQELPPSLARVAYIERLDGGAFEIASGSKADTLGAQVAHAVHRGITHPKEAPAERKEP